MPALVWHVSPHEDGTIRSAAGSCNRPYIVAFGAGGHHGRAENETMLKLALFFLVVSIIAALFGFTGISAATAGIARILFFIAIVIFLIFLVLALMAGNAIF
jgi:uncharacterized membrane protein YtjA (UPF0391 family)